MRSTSLRVLTVVLLSGSLGGCAVFGAGHTSSPWEFGPGAWVAPMLDVGPEGITVHPLASYTYLSFDGGRNDLFEFGAQVRRHFGVVGQSLWVSGQGAVAHVRTSYSHETYSGSGSDTGWSAFAIVGTPIQPGIDAIAAAGLTGFGGGTGKNIRLGVEVQPSTFRR